LSLEA